jgi:glycosyltransferase involved in cell wall biosynthesis
MPRKNSRLVTQVQRIVREQRPDLFARIEWVSIQGKSRSEVADILRSCHLFVASGFPEGFSMPPLEAMACGAIPVGFTGLGGWDYMRQADNDAYGPSFALRSVPWGGNGLFYADGDVLGLARGVEEMAGALRDNPERGASLLRAGQMTARTYGQNNQQKELHSWIKSLGLA